MKNKNCAFFRELEAFITANTVELAKDKWLCPLSGKKFKGPEFIRKHLTSKHQDKLDEVKVEVTTTYCFFTIVGGECRLLYRLVALSCQLSGDGSKPRAVE